MKGVQPVDEIRAVQLALETVSLTTLEHRLTKRLSGGEKRRLSIAVALLGEPVVVFLDEPTVSPLKLDTGLYFFEIFFLYVLLQLF